MAEYTVQRGDTLSAIAQAQGLDLADLIAANPQISDPNVIQIGQVITIPSGSGGGGGTSDLDINVNVGLDATNAPDDFQVWKDADSGQLYMVYFVPDTEPPVPMLWELDGEDELETLLGPGRDIVVHETFTQDQMNAVGATFWGAAVELTNTSEHPFDAWANLVDAQAAVRPWLRDEEVLTLLAQALLEGREVTEAEFQQTEWWQSHNADQRKWLLFVEADPASAQQFIDDSTLAVYDLLLEYGVTNPPQRMVDYIARQRAMGNWSEQYMVSQLTAISNPHSGRSIDQGLLDFVGDLDNLDTNQQHEEQVRRLVAEWLGPRHGAWSDERIARWATRFRESPDAQDELVTRLRQMRMALFSEYEDPNLTYEDIAQPWRTFGQQVWGQQVDETDPLFQRILRANDSTEAGKMLTRAGLRRGIRKVEQDVQLAMDEAFGGPVANLRRR